MLLNSQRDYLIEHLSALEQGYFLRVPSIFTHIYLAAHGPNLAVLHRDYRNKGKKHTVSVTEIHNILQVACHVRLSIKHIYSVGSPSIAFHSSSVGLGTVQQSNPATFSLWLSHEHTGNSTQDIWLHIVWIKQLFIGDDNKKLQRITGV